MLKITHTQPFKINFSDFFINEPQLRGQTIINQYSELLYAHREFMEQLRDTLDPELYVQSWRKVDMRKAGPLNFTLSIFLLLDLTWHLHHHWVKI